MLLKKIVTLGGVGIAGLALIGAGAAATFTQDTNSSQTVNAGYINVVLSADGADGNGTPTITLPAVGPTGSTFTAGPNLVTITNTGNIPANEIRLQVTDEHNNATLQSETWACLYSGTPSGGLILFNEPLTTAEGYGAFALGTQLIPPPDYYTLVLYAGQAYTGCGAESTSISGGAFQPGGASYTGPVPTAGANPAAASLTNGAENGSLTVKVTISYQG